MQLELQPEWYGLMRSGQKTVEGRVDPEKFRSLGAGQVLCIQTAGDTHRLRVKDKRVYPTLEAYLAAEWRQAAPQAATLEEARALYADVWTVAKTQERDGQPPGTRIQAFGERRVELRGGIVAIEVEPIGP